MMIRENPLGGVDIHNEKGKFVAHLNADELKQLFDIQQKNYDIDTVIGRIPDWVNEKNEHDFFIADFNSQLFSDDEISAEEICEKILDDKILIRKIAQEYRFRDDSGCQLADQPNWWDALNEAIENNVSIKDVLGKILCDKHPKEFCIGKWRVAVVEQGEPYGRYASVVHDDVKPVVEFYDMSQDKERFPEGQFTGGRYYLETLMKSDTWSESIAEMAEAGCGLCLHGDVPSWTVAPAELAVIATWLNKVQDNLALAEKAQEPVKYHGEVDVPFGYGKLAEVGYDAIPEKVAEDIILSRLSVIPEFNDVNVEQFGVYNEGYGLNFTFTTKLDEVSVAALLHHAFNGLKYDFYHDDVESTFENTLSEAQERSEQSAAESVQGKNDKDLDK